MADLLSNGRLAESTTVFVTSGTPVNLTVLSGPFVRFTGSTFQTVRLPNATTCYVGQRFVLLNRSTETIRIFYQDTTTYFGTVEAGKEAEIRLLTNGAANGTWDQFQTGQFSEAEPFKLTASLPPTALLNISASLVTAGDGSGKAASPIDSVVVSALARTINMQSEVQTGGTIVDGVGGPTLTFPYTTIGNFRRLVLAAQDDASVAASFSTEQASVAALTNAGTLLEPLGGLPLGYVDLEATVGLTTFTFAPADVDPAPGFDNITITAHGFTNGRAVSFSSTGTLPGGLLAATTYYIVGVTLNTFQVSLTSGGAAVDITSIGTLVHTVTTTAFKTAGSLTSIIENDVAGTVRVFRFGSGGGGGGSVALKNGGLETEIDTTETTYSIDTGKVNFHPFMHVLIGHTLTVPSGARLLSTDDTIDGTVVVDPGGVWKVL